MPVKVVVFNIRQESSIRTLLDLEQEHVSFFPMCPIHPVQIRD